MPGLRIQDFRDNVRDVARPNRFILSIPTPPKGIGNFNEEYQYHVRSASLPGRTTGDVTNLFWQGMNYKIAGDPTYDDLTFTFLNNENFEVKKFFEMWINNINNTTTNERVSPADYKAVIQIDQLGKSGTVIGTYYLQGAYPKSLEALELNQETIDAVEEFTVTFSLDYWSSELAPGEGEGIVKTA